MELSTFHYFFSAWLQADAALFAIVGIFVVYKLQSLETVIQSARSTLFNLTGVHYLKIEEFENSNESVRLKIITAFENSTGDYDKSIARQFRLMLFSMDRSGEIKDLLPKPMVLFSIGMISCGAMLMLSEPILSASSYFAYLLMIICLAYHIIIFRYIIQISKNMIQPFYKQAVQKAKS